MNLGTLQSGPSQPVLNTFPQSTSSGNKLRSFNTNYYNRFPDFKYSDQNAAVLLCMPNVSIKLIFSKRYIYKNW